LEVTQDVIKRLKDALAALPSRAEIKSLPCPHCAKPIAVIPIHEGAGVRLAKSAEPLSEKELAERRANWKDASDAVAAAEQTLREQQEEARLSRTALAESTKASEKLEELGRADATGTTLQNDHAKAQAAHNAAVKAMADWSSWIEAETLAARIDLNTTVIDILAPDGLRKQKLLARL